MKIAWLNRKLKVVEIISESAAVVFLLTYHDSHWPVQYCCIENSVTGMLFDKFVFLDEIRSAETDKAVLTTKIQNLEGQCVG